MEWYDVGEGFEAAYKENNGAVLVRSIGHDDAEEWDIDTLAEIYPFVDWPKVLDELPTVLYVPALWSC